MDLIWLSESSLEPLVATPQHYSIIEKSKTSLDYSCEKLEISFYSTLHRTRYLFPWGFAHNSPEAIREMTFFIIK
jgi:hypothetical protein